MPIVDVISLQETAQKQYLNYALSVITSRALPDVRDGLKPVHRRILYAMFHNLRLLPEGRYRKSATVVGEVMGKYHPHGDSAIYDAMVRMAQDFSQRYQLIDGHGNFGSIDGDSPAAMRYTEAKLRPLAVDLIEEIRKQTVNFRPNYDGTLFEPVVLPAQLPNLLINGASGIAVGMATNIPPHNLSEVVDAAILLSQRNCSVEKLMEVFHGPDFPTGGSILNTQEEILEIYKNGEGAIELRGEYKVGRLDDGKSGIIIYSIPFGLSKGDLIEKMAEHVQTGKLPLITDIRDESTEEIRIVLELKRGASAEKAMAYLFKHTPLRTRFHVNLTCLVPTSNPEICVPQKVDLRTALQHFLDFRYSVIVNRLRYELDLLEKRIHILKGFQIIFNALDEAIKIIRASKDKSDAAQRLMHRFRLDDIQADAILETKLYRLSQLEIEDIIQELEEKIAKATEIRTLLSDENALWRLIRKELKTMKETYGDARRTTLIGPDNKLAYDEEDYIVSEDVPVIITRDGWIKRQRSYTDVSAIRIREGDEIGWILESSTRATLIIFTSLGKAYTIRIDQLHQTTGYGEPIQKLFNFADKEHIVGAISTDSRLLPKPIQETEQNPDLFETESSEPQGPFFVAISDAGYSVRLELEGFQDPSTKNGRTFMKLDKGQSVLGAYLARGDENICIASRQGRGLIFPVSQISIFKSAGKGVIAMRLDAKDVVLGFELSDSARKGLTVETNRGRQEVIRTTKYEISNRGNKGKNIITKGTLTKVILETQIIEL